MREDEAKDVDGVVAEGPELGVGETVDDEEDRGRDVADEGAPEHGDVPILAGADDDVQVAAELVTLVMISGWEFSSAARSTIKGLTE